MSNNTERLQLETKLKSFSLAERKSALAKLISLVEKGKINFPSTSYKINLHCHTFYSFNAYDHSPTSLVWLAKSHGFQVVGMVDFDVLDGVDEFLDACGLVEINGTAGIETRIYIPEFCNDEINSPGEPGIAYHMGIGFPSGRLTEKSKIILENLRKNADQRNQTVINRVNDYLYPVSLDYRLDVLPLTPANSPTERHIVQAYFRKSQVTQSDLSRFWSDKLNLPVSKIETLLEDPAAMQNMIRTKLIKRGGPGYINPDPESFPSMERFHQLITDSRALPCFAWLDGTSSGEMRVDQLLELQISKGVVAVNIIPDRNWNYEDSDVRKNKLSNLYSFVDLAKKLDLPINIGTEMNSFGQKIIDDLQNEFLAPLWKDFINGAHFVYGHTIMERFCKMGYQSKWAGNHFLTRKEYNDFYIRVGRLKPMKKSLLVELMGINWNMTPEDILRKLRIGENYG
jgi:hypothetical protein